MSNDLYHNIPVSLPFPFKDLNINESLMLFTHSRQEEVHQRRPDVFTTWLCFIFMTADAFAAAL